jgi:hypothetical protein
LPPAMARVRAPPHGHHGSGLSLSPVFSFFLSS